MIRSRRQTWLLVLVGILLATNIITLSVLWSDKKNHKKGNDQPKRMGQFMVDQMHFDSIQEAGYWRMRDTLVVAQKPVWDSIREAKKRFYDLLNQPEVSDSLLQARSNEVIALQQRLDMITFRHFQQVRTLCKPEQLQKFDTVIKEIVNRMTNFRQPRNNKDSAQKK